MDVERTIREALEARVPLALVYGGDQGPTRTVHPQVLFLSSAGELSVDCWQVTGYSASGKPLPGWRGFAVPRIARVAIASGAFGPAPGFNLDAAKYRRVLAHV